MSVFAHPQARHPAESAHAGLTAQPATSNPVFLDPIAYLAEIEAAWQRRDGAAAAAAYTDDAVLIYGNGQTRTGDALRAWPPAIAQLPPPA